MIELSLDDLQQAVRAMAQVSLANERYFCELDAVAGDADFGVSLASGFRVVQDDWDRLDHSAIGQFLTSVSMIMIRHVGGCSGPIWGTAFMRAGAALKDKQSATLEEFRAALQHSIEGIMQRGGAKPGDKTLLDPLVRIHEMLANHKDDQSGQGALAEAVAVAEATTEETRDWIAMRGRQSFTGERSKGTLDPGMVAVTMMLKEIQDTFTEQTQGI